MATKDNDYKNPDVVLLLQEIVQHRSLMDTLSGDVYDIVSKEVSGVVAAKLGMETAEINVAQANIDLRKEQGKQPQPKKTPGDLPPKQNQDMIDLLNGIIKSRRKMLGIITETYKSLQKEHPDKLQDIAEAMLNIEGAKIDLAKANIDLKKEQANPTPSPTEG